ncbi:ABC transporter ATP-binding protein [Virgibacillus pantothenticus]|uniref:ABC transporter ATP-binding protein n=1 Tax=Virgibacillus pantothenticus TaxID=1473 RepID=UPI00098751E6|nr:ABC transporter ATP-binding protein [Virgibacillus pantothenticus]
MSFIELSDIYKVYNEKHLAIDNFNLTIEKNEFVALIGPSGCGKSTLLRMISGLEDITYGNLIIDGKRMNDVHAKDRDMSMVFQNYALYPHLTNYDNIAFGLKLRKVKKEIIKEQVMEVAKILDLGSYLERHPSELSGGQRQRVALGRAMVQNSQIFLMDEPLSNLDAKLRNRMRIEILNLHKQLGVTTIYVTHDQVEAMTMADKIVVMNEGKIQQIGHPRELYYNPTNMFVAQFIGDPDINIMEGTIEGCSVHIGQTTIPLNKKLYTRLDAYQGKQVSVGIRAEDFRTENVYIESAEQKYAGSIELIEMRGDSSILITKFNNTEIAIKVPSNQKFDLNQRIDFAINQARVLLFDNNTGERI